MKRQNKDWEEELAQDGRIYWYNKTDGISQWKDPSEDTFEDSFFWKTAKDKKGRQYYYNSRTKAVQWERPSDYTQKIEKTQRLKSNREKFFKMLSSSVPEDLNPFKNHSPDVFTLKEASGRFDRDPRLITISDPERERFLDEWITLERKRRVELERRLVSNAMEKLRKNMLDKAEAGEITPLTTWDDLIQLYKFNQDWRLLLNYDRLQVFSAVHHKIYQETIIKFAEKRENQLKEEARRRVMFNQALSRLLAGKHLALASYSDFQTEIESLPEFSEIQKNLHGSTAEDLFYNYVDDATSELEAYAKTISFDESDLKFQTFISNHSECDFASKYTEKEIHFIYQVARHNYSEKMVLLNKTHEQKKSTFFKACKQSFALSSLPPFEEAKPILETMLEYQVLDPEIGPETYQEYINIKKINESDEPGVIFSDDAEYIDLSAIQENQILKKTCFANL